MDIMIDVASFTGSLPPPEIKANTPLKDLPEDFPIHKYDIKEDLWSEDKYLQWLCHL